MSRLSAAARTRFESAFPGARRVFLPVIHPASHRAAVKAVAVAVEAGAHGVFLINQGLHGEPFFDLVEDVQKRHPGLWVGLNYLGSVYSAVERSATLPEPVRGLWTDGAPLPLKSTQRRLWAVEKWEGLYFPGVAFKTHAPVAPKDLPAVVKKAIACGPDVLTTSGRGTGQAADPAFVARFRELAGTHPVALASGVTPENVDAYLPHVDAYIVASGIEDSFGVLNPARTRALADKIRSFLRGQRKDKGRFLRGAAFCFSSGPAPNP